MTLTDRAVKIETAARKFLHSPAAILLPAPVRALLCDLCALITDLAQTTERNPK